MQNRRQLMTASLAAAGALGVTAAMNAFNPTPVLAEGSLISEGRTAPQLGYVWADVNSDGTLTIQQAGRDLITNDFYVLGMVAWAESWTSMMEIIVPEPFADWCADATRERLNLADDVRVVQLMIGF